jgi:hypothetical protein
MSGRIRAAPLALLLAVSVVAGTVPVGGTTATVAAENVAVVDGSAAPDEVSPGTTVNNQQVHVVVDSVSADGDTDRYYVEFPNDLADGLSPNYAAANDTAITSSIQTVDGYDDDGVDDTLTFATSATGGGSIPLNLTVDTGVDYPDTEDTHEIDFRVVDSSNGQDTQADVVAIQSGTPPSISDYTVSNPSGREVRVAFDASEELADITVDLTDGAGRDVATLTESDFTGTESDGTWTYTATHTVGEDGQYTATLTEARDAGGLDGASGQQGTVRVNTVDVAIAGGDATPATVTPGTTVDNQQVTVTLSGVSADGDTDRHYVEVPNALADGLAVNSASVNGSASIAQSAELVDGFDDDGIAETVRFQTDTDAGGTVALNVTVDVSVDYPSTDSTYGIDARTEDSDGDIAQQTDVTTVEATGGSSDSSGDTSDGTSDGTSGGTDDTSDGTSDGSTDDTSGDSGSDTSDGTSDGSTDDNTSDGTDDDSTATGTAPAVDGFDLTADGRTVDVAVALNGTVETLRVGLDGAVDRNLTRAAFTHVQANGTHRYTTTVAADGPGTVTATLEVAGDERTNLTTAAAVPLRDGSGPTGAATPPWTGNGSSAHTLTVPVRPGAPVVGHGLYGMTVEYGTMFGAGGGSVTSVSDDQNVAVLKVIRPDGTVKSELGGTDAVTVDTVDDEVRLDLSDVDSSRRPTLAAGDRVAVRLEPVTNPGLPGDYAADVTLAGPNGTTESATAIVRIRNRSTTAALDTAFVWLRNDPASVALNGSGPVGAVTVDSNASAIGPVRVTLPDDRPPAASDAPGRVLTVANVSRPPLAAGSQVTLTTTLAAEFDGNASALVVARYDEATDSWAPLGTEVVAREDGTVTVAVTSPGTSMFAFATTADAEEQPTKMTATPTPRPDDDTPTATPASAAATDTPTSAPSGAGGPGLGIVVVLIATVVAGVGALLRLRLER